MSALAWLAYRVGDAVGFVVNALGRLGDALVRDEDDDWYEL